jgi:hypothetical protein
MVVTFVRRRQRMRTHVHGGERRSVFLPVFLSLTNRHSGTSLQPVRRTARRPSSRLASATTRAIFSRRSPDPAETGSAVHCRLFHVLSA